MILCLLVSSLTLINRLMCLCEYEWLTLTSPTKARNNNKQKIIACYVARMNSLIFILRSSKSSLVFVLRGSKKGFFPCNTRSSFWDCATYTRKRWFECLHLFCHVLWFLWFTFGQEVVVVVIFIMVGVVVIWFRCRFRDEEKWIFFTVQYLGK